MPGDAQDTGMFPDKLLETWTEHEPRPRSSLFDAEMFGRVSWETKNRM